MKRTEMSTTLKAALAGAVITAGLAVGLASPASASPGSGTSGGTSYLAYAVSDSEAATCAVLGENLTGNVTNDSVVVLGVAKAIANHYAISDLDGVRVENQQVQSYCPSYWPNLVAVGRAARYRDGDGDGGSSV